jgi:hypothetical protein
VEDKILITGREKVFKKGFWHIMPIDRGREVRQEHFFQRNLLPVCVSWAEVGIIHMQQPIECPCISKTQPAYHK